MMNPHAVELVVLGIPIRDAMRRLPGVGKPEVTIGSSGK